MLWIVSLVLAIPLLIYYFLKKDHEYWKVRGVPFPKPVLLLGNLGPTINSKLSMGQIYADIYRQFEGFKYSGVYNFRTPGLIIRDLDLIRDVLVKNFSNFQDNWFAVDETVDPILSKNPFFSKGEKWKAIRTQLSPHFTSVKVKNTFPLIDDVCKNLVTFIRSQIKDNPKDDFNGKDVASRFTVSVVASCAFGLEVKIFENTNSDFFAMSQKLMDPDGLNFALYFISMFFPYLRKIKPLRFMNEESEKWLRDVVTNTLKYRRENNITREDFLNSFGKDDENITDIMVANAFTFITDGFETSSTVIQYALYELAENPDIQEKLREEVNDVISKHEGQITFESVHEMSYLDMVFLETMRKYPPSLFMSRVCTQDCVFPSAKAGGHELKIEKETVITIPTLAIHMDDKYYPEPEKFDPNRFTEKAKQSRPKYSFLAFGEGPRICIGQRFASTQVKACIANIINNFDVKLNPKTQTPLEMDPQEFMHAPKGGIWLNFYDRM